MVTWWALICSNCRIQCRLHILATAHRTTRRASGDYHKTTRTTRREGSYCTATAARSTCKDSSAAAQRKITKPKRATDAYAWATWRVGKHRPDAVARRGLRRPRASGGPARRAGAGLRAPRSAFRPRAHAHEALLRFLMQGLLADVALLALRVVRAFHDRDGARVLCVGMILFDAAAFPCLSTELVVPPSSH